ncbi:hypothetical protein F4823DRAFT_582793 [Ustulina deusta]|nr:hypothetical protein F4823DRAFT_582793 [Ustulina deusta]
MHIAVCSRSGRAWDLGLVLKWWIAIDVVFGLANVLLLSTTHVGFCLCNSRTALSHHFFDRGRMSGRTSVSIRTMSVVHSTLLMC